MYIVFDKYHIQCKYTYAKQAITSPKLGSWPSLDKKLLILRNKGGWLYDLCRCPTSQPAMLLVYDKAYSSYVEINP